MNIHFGRVFNIICGISIPEYIRNRRLSMAGQELTLSKIKIVDLAIKYQYESSTAFSRAFEKFHGIKPSQVKINPEKLKLYTKLHFEEIKEHNKNLEYKIVEREEMTLYGCFKVTNNQDISHEAPEFFSENKKKYGCPVYGMVEYKDKERRYVKAYWVMYQREKEGMEKVIIPRCRWIEIKINSNLSKDIQNVSHIFYKEFLPNCIYNFKELPELEEYKDNVTNFLIPIED